MLDENKDAIDLKVLEKKERKELKKLEMFQYDKTSTLRASTRQIKENGNYYSELIKGIPKVIINSDDFPMLRKGKKRGRKEKSDKIIQKIKKQNGHKLPYEAFDSGGVCNNLTPAKGNSICGSSELSQNGNGQLKPSSFEIPVNITTPTLNEEIYEETIVDLKGNVEKHYPLEVELYKNQTKNHEAASLKTFINCDLRFFNFDLLTKRVGYFDVIMSDPPWRIKGGQRNDSSFMFSNSKFNLEYNTLSNNEILSIPVENLSQKGNYEIFISF